MICQLLIAKECVCSALAQRADFDSSDFREALAFALTNRNELMSLLSVDYWLLIEGDKLGLA